MKKLGKFGQETFHPQAFWVKLGEDLLAFVWRAGKAEEDARKVPAEKSASRMICAGEEGVPARRFP